MDIEDSMKQTIHNFLMESSKSEDPTQTLFTLLATFIHYTFAHLAVVGITRGKMSEEEVLKNHRDFLEMLSEMILDESVEWLLIKELEKIKCKH